LRRRHGERGDAADAEVAGDEAHCLLVGRVRAPLE
jgi:hypothetical protein